MIVKAFGYACLGIAMPFYWISGLFFMGAEKAGV